MFDKDSVSVVPGQEFDLLRYSAEMRQSPQSLDPQRPHGFQESWKNEDMQCLCDLVRTRYVQLLGTMPPELVEFHLQRNGRIQLFGLFCPQQEFQASHMEVLRTGQTQIELGGILFNTAKVSPQNLTDEKHRVHENIAHELGHVTTVDAVNASETIAESFANRIAKEIIVAHDSQNLQSNTIRGTTGLRFADYSRRPPSNGYTQALYLSSPVALEHVELDKVWQVISALVEQAQLQKALPSSSDIFSKIRSVLGDQAQQIFDSPTFAPIQIGDHQFFFPERGKGSVFTSAFTARQTASGLQIVDTTVPIHIRDLGTKLEMSSNNAGGVNKYDFSSIIQMFQRTHKALANRIKRLECTVGRYKFQLTPDRVIFKG